ncbi:hypothetical protein [Nonomuraea sp. NPDC049709]|uniref:hypothetical protein n=1 Tax=Nonomuraea sp. NPDC049709 TaxID=3154736 RepID=UPI00342E9C07
MIAVEDFKIRNMTRSATGTREAPGRNVGQKAGPNRGMLVAGWGRLERKAPDRVVMVKAVFMSQRCSVCGIVDRQARESQPRFPGADPADTPTTLR